MTVCYSARLFADSYRLSVIHWSREASCTVGGTLIDDITWYIECNGF